MNRKLKAAAIAATFTASAVVLTGCSSGSTDPDQMMVHYEGGSFSSRKFANCVDPGTRDTNGPGDKYYAYPVRQVTYDATGSATAESKPFTTVSSDNAEMRQPASVTLTPNWSTTKEGCQLLRKFHETIGNKYHAWTGGSDFVDDNDDSKSDGWVAFLNFYVGQQLDQQLDTAEQGYPWRDLWNKPGVKSTIGTTVKTNLQTQVDAVMGGKFFTINAVTLLKPTPTNSDLVNNTAREQADVAAANSAKAKAEADEAAALAQIAVAQAEAKAKKAAVEAAGGPEAYLKQQAIDKGMNPYAPSPIVVGGGSAQGR